MPEEFVQPSASTEMSFSDKFVGILSSPSDVFQSITTTEAKTSNWAIPLVLAIVISLIFTFVVFTQPAIQDQMKETQQKAMQERVAEGKMTQEQMDTAMEFSKPGSPMFLIFGSVGVIVVLAVALFAYSLVYWLIGKIAFKSGVGFTKVLEVNGLAMYIAPVATLLTMVLIIAMGSLYAQPSAALFISNFDPQDKMHKALAALNVFEFWAMFVTGIGLSKVWKVSFGKGLGVVLVVWVVWTAIKIFAGIGPGM